jgi:hypothetical protein
MVRAGSRQCQHRLPLQQVAVQASVVQALVVQALVAQMPWLLEAPRTAPRE